MRRTTRSEPAIVSPDRGRPREFDIDEVTRAAGRVFWEQGYNATSIDTLCKSTGLFRASLYSAFGDKHGLLVAAFDQYAEGAVARLKDKLEGSLPPDQALRQALLHYTRVAAKLSGRHGCFITNTAIELLPADEVLRQHVESTLQRIAAHLAAAVVRGQEAGTFDSTLDEHAVSQFLLCVIQGLRVLGKVNVSESDLVSVVDMTMRALI